MVKLSYWLSKRRVVNPEIIYMISNSKEYWIGCVHMCSSTDIYKILIKGEKAINYIVGREWEGTREGIWEVIEKEKKKN